VAIFTLHVNKLKAKRFNKTLAMGQFIRENCHTSFSITGNLSREFLKLGHTDVLPQVC
jgi:hypothetical protein